MGRCFPVDERFPARGRLLRVRGYLERCTTYLAFCVDEGKDRQAPLAHRGSNSGAVSRASGCEEMGMQGPMLQRHLRQRYLNFELYSKRKVCASHHDDARSMSRPLSVGRP